jgi:hypothetical protein
VTRHGFILNTSLVEAGFKMQNYDKMGLFYPIRVKIGQAALQNSKTGY